MDDRFTIYGSFTSSSSYKPMLFLALARIPHSFKTVNLKTGAQKLPDYLAINRYGLVPALRHRGLTIVQSNVILDYLARATGKFEGASEQDRWRAREWLSWEADAIQNIARVRHFSRFRTVDPAVMAHFRPLAEAALDLHGSGACGPRLAGRRGLHHRRHRLLGTHGVHGRRRNGHRRAGPTSRPGRAGSRRCRASRCPTTSSPRRTRRWFPSEPEQLPRTTGKLPRSVGSPNALILIEAFMDPPAHYVESMLPARVPPTRAAEPISVGLNAAILAVRGDEPMVAVVPAARREREGDGALPCGPFSPRQHKTLEAGLRFWVRQQTGIELGHTRQICTLGDCHGPDDGEIASDPPVVSVCYLAPVRPAQCNDQDGAVWRSWYAYFPWEDWRRGKPAMPDGDHRAPSRGVDQTFARPLRGPRAA